MQIILPVEKEARRLDRFLADSLPQYSRAYLQKLIAGENVKLDGKKARASESLLRGQEIEVNIPAPKTTKIAAEVIPLDIVFEDEWLLVVNKPQGMVVHPAAGHRAGTLVNALLNYCSGQLSDLNGVVRPGIVHRIDKDTSGLLLVVKDNRVHMAVAEKIRRHEVKRTYQAVVHGDLEADSGTIEAPIGRDRKNRQRMAVIANGKPSVTHFEVLHRFGGATHLQIRLETGRTHQIRVHFKHIGHPVLGDPLYSKGRKDFALRGQALHAAQLEFIHPVTDKNILLQAPLPAYFTQLLERLD